MNTGIKIIVRHDDDAAEAAPLFVEALRHSIVTIGSDPAATVRLNGNDAAAFEIAPEQALIINEADQLLLINREAGTTLNGEQLMREARRSLAVGDELRIGAYIISFVADETPHEQPPALTPESSSVNSNADAGVAPSASAVPPFSMQQPQALATETPPRSPNFAAILDSLRTEEDSFYFLIEGGAQAGTRLSIESAEMPLGWDEAEREICYEPGRIATACAVVRKDWSGVVVQSQGDSLVLVNGEAIATARRLRDGDYLTLLSHHPGEDKPRLIFHEPASLLVLDSLLPQHLPEPVSTRPAQEAEANANAATHAHRAEAVGGEAAAKAEAAKNNVLSSAKIRAARRYFRGAFTAFDLIVLLIGTLAATLVVYLMLHFFA